MTSVIVISAVASDMPVGTPQRTRTGANLPDRVAAPKAADRNPASVTPICSAARKRLGLPATRATLAPRRPRPESALSWLSRNDTSAISVEENRPPTRMKTRTRAILAQVLLTAWTTGDDRAWRSAYGSTTPDRIERDVSESRRFHVDLCREPGKPERARPSPEEKAVPAEKSTPWPRWAGPARLAYGGDYNPEQWPEDVWAQDVRLMGEAGVNLVSVGIFSWALLEPSPGRYEFGWLDQVLDLLHGGGIAVDLATGTASPPPWFSRLHPESLPVDRAGSTLWPGGRQAFCPSSTAYRAAIVELTGALATRYGGHPALAMWHVHNEYGCHNAHCYCDVSAGAFRRWLQARYGDLDALN